MHNQEMNDSQTPLDFDRNNMEDVFRVYQAYAAEHTGIIMTAGKDVPYSMNECRGLACKTALWSWDVMHYSEAIDRINGTIKILVSQLETEKNQEQRHELGYLIQAQVNMINLFTWMESYGPTYKMPLDDE